MDINTLKAHNGLVRQLLDQKQLVLDNARRVIEVATPMLHASLAEPTPNPATIDAIQQECEELVVNIKDAMVRIEDIRRKDRRKAAQIASLSSLPVPPKIQILQAKKRRLEAEIKQIKARPPNFNPQIDADPQTLRQFIKQDVEATLHQLDITTSMAAKDIAEDTAGIERTQILLAELTQLEESIEKKLGALKPKASAAKPKQRRAQVLDARNTRIQAINAKLMTQMSSFVDSYFPASSIAKDAENKSAGEEAMDVEGASMKHILQDLMNQAVLEPDDPWINIERKNWAQSFISFLLISGVAEAHPTDARLIKLQDFHL